MKVAAHDLAAEIVRRAGGLDLGYVVHLSDPPTNRERLMLVAHKLTGKPFAIMPNRCSSVEEWLDCYCQQPQ